MSEYFENSKKIIKKLRQKKDFLVLSFESSCDETAVSVTKGKKVLSSKISSQIEIHKRFGGVVPEIASRNHILQIDNILNESLSQANTRLCDIDVIAVTYGAGLLGALLVGVSYAKSLAYALNKPIIGINHIKGHIFANFISSPELNFPFLCLLASGGHTEILKVKSYSDIHSLAKTRDDAAGEAFDKVARVLGLPYPGGPEIEKYARKGKNNIYMPRAFKGEKHLDFSYSGLKTAVINYVHNKEAKGEIVNPYDVACSFQTEATNVLIDHAIEAAKRENIKTIALAGGVGANSVLREGLKKEGDKNNIKIILPPNNLCTDNAAMIGVAAYFAIIDGQTPDNLNLDAKANL